MNDADPRRFLDQHFATYHESRNDPFDWQRELFSLFIRGVLPPRIDLPTGTGKTSMMLIWYLALAWQVRKGIPITIPRRLVWVVNRRVVVDEATSEAEKLLLLRGLLPQGRELAISTLRGELADNGEWKTDPSRPAIVIGTVDMVGSRLLFSGYGDGPYWRPQHAGLLGVDAFFVNDEAHLTPAFSKLLRTVEKANPAAQIPGKLFRFCELSATHTDGSRVSRFPENLDRDLAANPEFQKRYTADKRLYLHCEADRKKVDAKLLDLATDLSAPRTIIYLEKPEEALALAEKLQPVYLGGVELLTGTMRGYERDRLTETEVFQAFQRKEPPAQSICLVATSAGEVGVNITAERQITTLAEADHLIQRFGRLNRFGGERGDAHLVYVQPGEKDKEFKATVKWLEALPNLDDAKDIRASTLRDQPPQIDAFTPPPPLAELQAWLVELWCQTSGNVNSYPLVAPWLHGKQEDLPETSVAWRWDVAELGHPNVSEKDREAVLRYFPVLAHEKLTEPTSRLQTKLAVLAQLRPEAQAIVRCRDGSVEIKALEKLSDLDLDEAVVVLPPGIGRLHKGMLIPEVNDESDTSVDVADEPKEGRANRRRHIEPEETLPEGYKILLRIALFDESYDDSEHSERYLVYSVAREAQKGRGAKEPYLLKDHHADVAKQAYSLAAQLVPDLAGAFKFAGAHHDCGKARPIWQQAMGRCNGEIVAKPFQVPKPKQLAGYRHELGSLVETSAGELTELPLDTKDVVLHLIASHHGHGRPFFRDQAHDVRRFKDSTDEIRVTSERFGRLVEQWGPWGLAYLEAIFKAADALASKQADERFNTEEQVESD